MDAKSKIHSCYILGILLAVIIVLAAARLTKIPDLVDYISFALTLTALVLAILTIVHSLFSNSSVMTTISSLRDYSEQASRSTEQLTALTDELRDVVEGIPGRLESVESAVRSTHQIVAEGVHRDAKAEGEEVRARVDMKEEFLATASLTGRIALYGAYRASLGGHKLDLDEAFPEIGGDYPHGFLVAAACAGLVNTKGSVRRLSILSIDEEIGSRAMRSIQEWIDEKDDDGLKAFARQALKMMDEYLCRACEDKAEDEEREIQEPDAA